VAPVELLEQHDARELVWQGQRSEREAMVDLIHLQPERAADDERQVTTAAATLLEKVAESQRIQSLALGVQQRHEPPFRQSPEDLLVLPDLDQLQTHVARQQLLVVLDVIGEWRAEPAHGDDNDPHDGILGDMDDPNTPERHINIHFSPDIMAGVYANFANVSHSDYEFTITFARVDHEVEDEEIPGVVVSRINLSPKFMRELIDAMQDNYSKWQTREGIKNLPEFGESGGEETD
jgi:hypothetical protein